VAREERPAAIAARTAEAHAMKDDVEIPAKVPTKRKVLESPALTLDKWLAVWAADPDQPPSARKRAQDERDRRKRLVPDVRVGVIVGEEGMTPAQRARLLELVAEAKATELHYDAERLTHLRRLLLPLDDLNVKAILHHGNQDVVRESTTLVAAPKDTEKPNVVEGVWEAVRYAKHRKVPVRVVMPDGSERT
jgi:hypothetical protein